MFEGAIVGFGKRGLFRKVHSRYSRVFRGSREPPDCGNRRESDHFLETLEKLEICESLEIPPVKGPSFVMIPLSGPDIFQP